MKWLKFIFKNIEELISGVFIVATVIIVIINVILRYFFNMGLYWSEEVATICFVWAVFVGASATYKHKMNIGIDFLVKRSPLVIQKIMRIFVDVLLIVIVGYLVYLSVIFTNIASIKPTAVLGISSAYVNASLVVGFGLMFIHAIRFFIEDIKFVMTEKKEEVE
ncbi:TRAP transporter small permease [Vallitaleaceae bacterium 9-2]